LKENEAKGRFFNNFQKKTSIFSNKRSGNELLPLNALKGLFKIFLLSSGNVACKGRNNLPKRLKSTKIWEILNSQVVLKIFLGNWKNWVFWRDDFCWRGLNSGGRVSKDYGNWLVGTTRINYFTV